MGRPLYCIVMGVVALSLACSSTPPGDGATETSAGSDSSAGTALPTSTDAATSNDTDTGAITDTTADTDTGATADTGTATDTDDGKIACPPIDPHIKYELDNDGVYDTVVKTQDELAILTGCTDIAGSLQISGDVTDLTALTSLRRIVGSLYIDDLGQPDDPAPLLSLAGLEGLKSVRSVELEYLAITSLQPLAGLTELAGGLKLNRLTELESLAGLDNLRHVGGPLTITSSSKIADLQALSGLTDLPDRIEIEELPALVSLEGLHNIEHIGDRLSISKCDQLVDLDGLRGLQRIDSRLFLGQLGITTLHGLEGLTAVGSPGGEPADISLYYLSKLSSLDALGLEWHDANGLLLYRSLVSDLDVFAGVTELDSLALYDNDDLVDLAGLESLVEIHAELTLEDNDNLVDLGALADLQTVGALTLATTALTDLALPALQQIGGVVVRDNTQLTSLTGLTGLSSLGSLELTANSALVGLPELSALTQVAGNFEIRGNAALDTVADLAALTSVGGRLEVVVNPSLLQSEAVAWAAAVTVGKDRKIAGNKGDVAPPADPCPWAEDGECDEKFGLGICAEGTDEWDCVIGD